MHCSSISPFVSHVSVFDLHGCADSGETGGVPCRVRVGPRRFLDITVFPRHFKCNVWARKDGKAVYLPGQEIPEQRDKHGTLFFDVLPYLRQRLGWECACTVDEYNWAQRRRLWSDTFLSTEYGVAAAYSSWQDITVYHSSLHLAPGALTVCGHDVQAISWDSFDRKSDARSEVLRPLVEKALTAPHCLDDSDIQRLLPGLEADGGLDFLGLCVTTDRGTFSMEYGYTGSTLSASLADGGKGACRTVSTKPSEVLGLMLKLMQADSQETLDAQLSNMHLLDLVTDVEED